MRLQVLDNKGSNPDVVILSTPSTKLTMFLEDKVKRHYGCRQESIIDVNTKKDLKKIKDVIGVVPPFSRRWFVSIDLDKLLSDDLVKLILESTTCVFFCTCSKYATFKDFKSKVKKAGSVFDFYINYLRRADFVYLYDAFVPEDKRLKKQLFDYVVQSYSGDIEALFNLFLALAEGREFKNRKQISDLCGLGGLSIESYIFSLLKPLSGSDKGFKKVFQLRVRAGYELAQSLGYSTFYNFTAKSLMTLIQLKTLLVSGSIYKTVYNLPEGYDEKALARYQKHIWRLNEIPLSRLLLLRQSMGTHVWRSELDFLRFIYTYYEYNLKGLVK